MFTDLYEWLMERKVYCQDQLAGILPGGQMINGEKVQYTGFPDYWEGRLKEIQDTLDWIAN